LEGNLTKPQIKKIKNNLLTDDIVEISNIYSASKKTTHKIEVWLKSGVTDVVGESVKEAILDMGMKNISDVRCGEVYYIKGKIAKTKLEFLAEKILVNPLIHSYQVA
jgi:phosphoribosylformylglycinamidine (FGAM) synthase PurS component